MFKIDGIIPIIPTPFSSDGSLNMAALDRLLEFAISARVCGVCLPAYASEFYKLSDIERRELVCHAIRTLNDRLPVVAQVNHPSAAYVAEEVAHKVTGKPATAFHLHDRGRIAEGYVADVTVFDPETVHTDASYDMPAVAPTGIKSVLRNGRVVVDAGVVV